MTNLPIDRGTRFGDLFDTLAKERAVRNVEKVVKIENHTFHSKYARSSTPIIYPACSPHQNNFNVKSLLSSEFGNLKIKVRHGDYVNPENYAPERRQLKEMTLNEYLEVITNHSGNDTPPYAGNFTLPQMFLDKIGASVPAFYPANIFEPPTVWLGARGCITPLHRDSSDNFAIQILGKKRWTIYPPQDAPFLYMTSVAASKGGDFATSAVDLRNADLDRFPLFSKAQSITFDVLPGEILYLPMGWSHYVENLEMSLMVNHWLSIAPLGVAALANQSDAAYLSK